MRCLIYARVSLDPRGEGRSVTEQEQECRAWAEREGWTVEKVIAETGSASRYARSTRARSRWNDVTQELTTGHYDALLTWEASRATRDLTAYAALRDLCATHNIAWVYSGTLHNLNDRDARFRTGLDALLAEDESARSSERIRRAVRARAAAGQPHGKLLYGYRREYDPTTGALLRQVPDEQTAPIVREIFQRAAAGEPIYGIARDLTLRGIPAPRPARAPRPEGQTNAWIPQTVRRVATNPAYWGRRIHKGEDVGPAAWEPLVTPKLADKAAAHIATRTVPHHGTTATRLLTGIARCGYCSGPMRAIKNRGYHAYSCAWCHKLARRITRTDEHVTNRVLALLEALGPIPATNDDDTPALAEAIKDLEALQTRLAGFEDAAADGNITPAAFARIEAKLLPQVRAARERVQQLRTPSVLAGWDLSNPRALWEELSLLERRELIRATVTVTILPTVQGARTLDPNSVVVEPRW